MTELDTELQRLAEIEATVQAWVVRRPADDLRLERSTLPAGPLQGFSLGVKDVIDTADLPTERGSPIYRGRTTVHDAACVALARRAGAQVVGKTATTEFALFTPTVTTNPHDPSRTPGGSSSGSAAAVAAGTCRIAFGTQTVGSVLRPAAFCGVVGMKPSHGLVPTDGVAALSPSFDTVGWMARTVADAGATLAAMTGVDPLPPGEVSGAGPAATRVGVYRSDRWSAAQPELSAVLAQAADRIADSGLDVTEIDPLPHLDGFFEAADVVFSHEVARVLAWEHHQHRRQISSPVAKLIDRAGSVTAEELAQAQRLLARARQAHDEYLTSAGLSALLTPSAPGEAPPIDTTGDSVFNRTWTSLGVPAVQLPAGSGPSGLPVGLTLAGRAWADGDLLGLAATLEDVLVG